MPTLLKAPRNTWNSISLLRSWKLKIINYKRKCQNKVDFYARTYKEGDEGILHSNGQDGFGFY
jgi:hypothetical protein